MIVLLKIFEIILCVVNSHQLSLQVSAYSASYLHSILSLSLSGVWHVPSVYVTCKGMSDLGDGPNKPTATIIGEYSAS